MSPPFGTIEWCPILGDISGFLAVLRFLYVIKKMQVWSKRGCFTLALNTVDGQNPARTPVEVGSLSHIFFRFCTSQVVFFPDFWTINSRCFHRYDSGRMARESLSPKKTCQLRPFFIVGGGALGSFTHCFWCTRNTCLFWCSFVATCIKQGSLL